MNDIQPTASRRRSFRRAAAWVAPLLGVIAITLVASACGGEEARDPLELVPARADLLGYVNFAEAIADADVEAAYELLSASDEDAPATLNELLAKGEEDLGLDLSRFAGLVFFGDSQSSTRLLADGDASGIEGKEFLGLLASTDLSRDQLFEAVRAGSAVQMEEIEQHDVPLLRLNDGDAAVTLVDGVVVLGSADAVAAVVEVARNDAPAISGDVLAFYTDLGDAWVKLALAVPADIFDGFGEAIELGLPVDLADLLEVTGIGLVATKVESDAVVRVVLRYPTHELALETQETITGLLDLLSSFAGEDLLGSLAGNLAVTSGETDVTIELRQGVQESLDDLRQSLDENESTSPLGLGYDSASDLDEDSRRSALDAG